MFASKLFAKMNKIKKFAPKYDYRKICHTSQFSIIFHPIRSCNRFEYFYEQKCQDSVSFRISARFTPPSDKPLLQSTDEKILQRIYALWQSRKAKWALESIRLLFKVTSGWFVSNIQARIPTLYVDRSRTSSTFLDKHVDDSLVALFGFASTYHQWSTTVDGMRAQKPLHQLPHQATALVIPQPPVERLADCHWAVLPTLG